MKHIVKSAKTSCVDVGGIKCPCCTRGSKPVAIKRLTNRLIRRNLKKDLRSEV